MKKTLPVLLVTAAILLFASIGRAQPEEQKQRIAASCFLALGRAPSAGELNDSSLQGLSIAELIARHRQQIQNVGTTKQAAIVNACRDAFGREPSEAEVRGWATTDRTYSELMVLHLKWLAEHPAEYKQVMNRVYQLLVRRDAYALESEYWERHDTLSYALLVACIENWARRNQPGLMVTAGTATLSMNSDYLATVWLSPAIATEARVAAKLSSAEGVAVPPAFGRNLVAPGAGEIVTSGGIFFAATGGPGLRALAATNLKRF